MDFKDIIISLQNENQTSSTIYQTIIATLLSLQKLLNNWFFNEVFLFEIEDKSLLENIIQELDTIRRECKIFSRKPNDPNLQDVPRINSFFKELFENAKNITSMNKSSKDWLYEFGPYIKNKSFEFSRLTLLLEKVVPIIE